MPRNDKCHFEKPYAIFVPQTDGQNERERNKGQNKKKTVNEVEPNGRESLCFYFCERRMSAQVETKKSTKWAEKSAKKDKNRHTKLSPKRYSPRVFRID